MTTKQPVFIEHLLCARNYPKNFRRLTGWFSQQLYRGDTVTIPILQMRKLKQSWFKVFFIENIVLESFSQGYKLNCVPQNFCVDILIRSISKVTVFGKRVCFVCLFVFYFLAAPWGMQDLSSPTRDQTHKPCSGSAVPQLLDGQGSPGEWVLKEVMKVKWGLQGGPSSDACMAGVLVRRVTRTQTHTETRPHEDAGRRRPPTSQRMLEATRM